MMNNHGYFTHQGRSKDMVIRGGENIYPVEIEQFLHQHPKIAGFLKSNLIQQF